MSLRTRAHWFEVTLDCPDPPALCRFYEALLGWTVYTCNPDGAVVAPSETAGYSLAFQRDTPRGAGVAGRGGRAVDAGPPRGLEVDDLAEAVAYAVSVGARLHEHQPQEQVRVMIDPAGHPFCLYLDG